MADFARIIDDAYASLNQTLTGLQLRKWQNITSTATGLFNSLAVRVSRSALSSIDISLRAIVANLAAEVQTAAAYGLSSASTDIEALRTQIYNAMPSSDRRDVDPALIGTFSGLTFQTAAGVGTPATIGAFAQFRFASLLLFGTPTGYSNPL